MSPTRTLGSSQSRSRLSMSMTSLPTSPGGGGFNPSASFSTLPELERRSNPSRQVSAIYTLDLLSFNVDVNLFPNTSKKQGGGRPNLSQNNEDLVNELSQRSLTDATTLRKKQIEVGREVMGRDMGGTSGGRGSSAVPGSRSNQLDAARESMGSRMGSSAQRNIFANDRRPMTTSSSSSRQGFYDQTNAQANFNASTGNLATIQESGGGSSAMTAEVGENFFMPKKKILRPDGASLLDIYQSKKADTWGKIIKAQYKEELEMNEVKRREKQKADEEYGIRLKQQLDERARAKEKGNKEDELFAALEDATVSR